MMASEQGHPECVTTLVKAGASVNMVDRDGHAALHKAVSCGHAACVKSFNQIRS